MVVSIASPAAVLQILVTANAAQAFTVLDKVDAKTRKSASNAERYANKTADVIAKTMKYGALGVGVGLALSVKAAADFESHFAEVRKTVSTNARGFAVLEKGIRRMARTIPVSANQLSDLAGQAGALGIRSRDLLRFTRTAAELGIATDLSAEDAANALARLSNIMGTSGKDFRRLGSTLVRLGNNGASTEAEIAAMALRISGAGKQVGLSEAQVLSYASALASVGIEAEAGGSAISRVFVNIATAVAVGGRALKGFADVAGMSTDAYQKAFRSNAADATLRFIEGLARIKRSGGDVFSTLENLRLGEIRVRDALLRASGAGRLFREQLAIGNEEWRRNTALTREANQRYQTAAARLQRLKNQVTDWGISIGQKLLPHLTKMMDILSDDRLTSEAKFDRLSRLIGPLLSRGIEEGVRIAGQAGPKIAGALASGISVAWTDMTPLSKLFTVGAIITAVGGRKALVTAGIALGRLLGGGFASGVVGGGAAGAAGGAAAGGAIAGIRSGLLVAAKRAGWIGVALTIADGIFSELGRQAKQRSSDLLVSLEAQQGPREGPFNKALDIASKPWEAATGQSWFTDSQNSAKALLPIMQQLAQGRKRVTESEVADISAKVRALDLTRQQRAQWERILAVLRQTSSLKIRADISGDMDPNALSKIRNNLAFLRAGWGTTLADILKVSRRNMALIRSTIGTNTADGRKLAADNMRATASAIEQAMERAGHRTKAGMERVKELIRNANLIDPSRKQAEAFGRSWAAGMDRSKEITRRGIRQMIAEAQKMPGPMRKVALDVWMEQLQAARKNGTITAGEFRRLRSRVAAEFTGLRDASRGAASGVAGSIANLVNKSTDGLQILAGNVNKTLSAFGARALQFDLKKVGDVQRRQTGGVIVPGQGTGDKVHAMLEPGEVVWNRKAVAAMGGARKVDAVNKIVPRFQSGGVVGYPGVTGDTDFLPALGFALSKMATATRNPIFVEDGRRSIAEQQFLYNTLSGSRPVAVPGPGAPHVRGVAADITPGRDAFGGVAGGFGLGFTVSSEPWHIELLNSLLGARGGSAPVAARLARMLLEGPDGALKTIGQAALDTARRAGQQVLDQQTTFAGFGGGDWQTVLQQIAGARGWSVGDWMNLVMRESGGNPGAVNPSSGAFGLGQFLGSTAQAYARYGALSSSGVDQIRAMAKYVADRYGNPTAALDFHNAHNWYQEGGIVQAFKSGGIARAIGTADRLARRRRVPRPRRMRAIQHALKLIDDVGLSDGRQRELFDLSQRADRASELAGRAADLSYDLLYAERTPVIGPDGVPIAGKFHEAGDPMLDADQRPMKHWEKVAGLTAFEWVRGQLDDLFTLRDRLIKAEGIVSREQRRIGDLIERTRRRLAEVQHKIAQTVTRRRSLDDQLRKAQDQLERAQKHPRRNRAQIRTLQGRITGLREKLRLNEVDQHLGERERTALQRILGKDGEDGLLGKRSRLREMRGNILGDGDSFKGLRTVQGFASMDLMTALPPIGVLGGEIFDAQKLYADYMTLPARVSLDLGGSSDDGENAGIRQQLLEEWQRRAFIANQQFDVLRNLGDLSLPFGGVFHTGGVVPGPASQEYMTILRGREGVLTPEQMAVTSAALVGGGGGQEVSVNVVITDRRTYAEIDGQEVRATVRDETRQIARAGRGAAQAGNLRRG